MTTPFFEATLPLPAVLLYRASVPFYFTSLTKFVPNSKTTDEILEINLGLGKRDAFLNEHYRDVESGCVSAWGLPNIVMPMRFSQLCCRCEMTWFGQLFLCLRLRAGSG